METRHLSIQRRVQRPLEEYRRVRTSHGVIFLAYEPSKRYLERTLPPEQNYVAMFTAAAGVYVGALGIPTEVSRRERKPAIKAKFRKFASD